MKFSRTLAVILLSAGTSLATVWGYSELTKDNTYLYKQSGSDSGKVPANYAGFTGFDGANALVDFVPASSAAVPATVHIKTKAIRTVSNNLPKRSPFGDLFDFDMEDFFGDRQRSLPQMASGSGAIISEDGYIVTNNHVIDGADEINVTLSNRRSFKAKLIGADPASDLAVIKIDAKGLPFLVYGNSDELKIGQWVLAIGYPLSLETTVTAGIVSAKGRTLDINARQAKHPVESFIQTDAAVNFGNSGGPLVNTDGQLVGINSAIASPTQAYAGYSFTIPVNIVKKIVADMMKYGTVQRAYLGIMYPPSSLTDEQRKEQGMPESDEGVYVSDVPKDGAAFASGIKKGDVITKVNDVPVSNGPEMVGQIATYRPGDKINISYRRNGKEYKTNVTLRNVTGTVDVVKTSVLDKLDADLAVVSKEDAKEAGISGGVQIKKIGPRGLLSKVRVQPGFIILKANDTKINTVDDFRKVLEVAKGSVNVEGIYPDYEGVFNFILNLDNVK